MKDFLRILAFFGVLVAALFGSAGRWDLPFVWAILGIYAGFMLIVWLTIDPDLRQERFHPAPGGKDRQMRAVLLPLMLAGWIVAGLDSGRFHWSDTVPFGVRVVALVGFVAGLGLAFWAMSMNRFFSPVVRIQTERGHRLVTAGPYQRVRHPGYLGGMLSVICSGLVLGSWWALLPVAGCVLIFLRRTALEDRFLIGELPGYGEYSERVRFRLLPGVW